MGAGDNDINGDDEEAAFVQLAARAVKKTNTDSPQTRTEKLHEGMDMGCKPRWDEEMHPRESPISWFFSCEKLMRKENERFISINIGEDCSFPH